MSDMGRVPAGTVPRLGADNDAVLGDLGLDADLLVRATGAVSAATA